MKRKYIIPIFVPHLGCPNDCTFCNQKKISGQKKSVSGSEVKEIVEYYLNSFNGSVCKAVRSIYSSCVWARSVFEWYKSGTFAT